MNKKWKLKCLLLCLSIGGGIHCASAQSNYTVEKDPNSGIHIYNGIISNSILLGDSTFTWYQRQQIGYAPNQQAVELLHTAKDSVSFIVFMGTWCEDSQNIIPKFYSLLQAADFDKNKVTLFGVNREKTTHAYIAQSFGLTLVPTIIAMRNGKEIGRVVEYGSTGNYEDGLIDIFMQPKN